MHDIIIIGSGPAGLTAGLYACRAKLNALILEKKVMGGELMERELIENYPGYANGVTGPELGTAMLEQAMNLGADIRLAEVERIRIEGNQKVVITSEGTFRTKALIIAGGAHPRKLGVPGEGRFANRGVFYCATCDGPAFGGKTVLMAGGGDSGITEALIMARIAAKVIVVEVMPQLGACQRLQEKVSGNPSIEVLCGTKIEEIRGTERVESVSLLQAQTGQRTVLPVDGVLVRVGIVPNTDYLKTTGILNERGQVVVNEKMETAVPGISAAGDIRENSPWQISTAVGDGATAALSAGRYVSQF